MCAVVTPATARVGDRARIDEKEAVWCELEKHGAYLKEKHGDGTLAKFVAAVRAYKKAQEEITEPLRRILVKTRAPKVFGSAPTVPRRRWFVGCETDPARARAARNDTDMHRYCRTVVLHDLNWNPAMLEQRVGRLDRVDALAEKRNPLGSRRDFRSVPCRKLRRGAVSARSLACGNAGGVLRAKRCGL